VGGLAAWRSLRSLLLSRFFGPVQCGAGQNCKWLALLVSGSAALAVMDVGTVSQVLYSYSSMWHMESVTLHFSLLLRRADLPGAIPGGTSLTPTVRHGCQQIFPSISKRYRVAQTLARHIMLFEDSRKPPMRSLLSLPKSTANQSGGAFRSRGVYACSRHYGGHPTA
jgi:hypothetical protein